jgi:hypothetical protein
MGTLRIVHAVARCLVLLPIALACDVRNHVTGKHSPMLMGGQELVW